jgi:enoyl-CoA hydratase/carnithine racemase
VTVERREDGVVLVLLNRPDRANALDDDTIFVRLPALFAELDEDIDVRAVVVSGAGKAFCAGVDLESKSFELPDAASNEDVVRRAHAAVVTLKRLRVPSIAAVNGVAVGAGFGLAAACDIRIASPTARFLAPFVRMGMVPDYGLSYNLPRLVGTSAALELLLTGGGMDATEAVRTGLASRIADDPIEESLTVAHAIASAAPRAVATARRNVYVGLDGTLESSVLGDEPRSVGLAVHSAEFGEYFPQYVESLRRKNG